MDIGHEKSVVCCIDEGIVVPNSKIIFPYGGKDVTKALEWLLKQSDTHFYPYSQSNVTQSVQDYEAINLLKESLCHCRKVNQNCMKS